MSQLDWTLWNMDGARMVQMTEADFSDRLPSKHGENLYAQFDIWRTNYNFETGTEQQVATAHTQFAPPPPYPDTNYWPAPTTGGAESIHTDTFGDIAYMLQVCTDTETSKISLLLREYDQTKGIFWTPRTLM